MDRGDPSAQHFAQRLPAFDDASDRARECNRCIPISSDLGNHGNLPGPGPGRAKGVPNKVNRDLKEAYLMAANLAGGKEGLVGYLKKQAELENPSAFMTGLSKLLPSMLEGNPDAPLIVERVYYTRDGDK